MSKSFYRISKIEVSKSKSVNKFQSLKIFKHYTTKNLLFDTLSNRSTLFWITRHMLPEVPTKYVNILAEADVLKIQRDPAFKKPLFKNEV